MRVSSPESARALFQLFLFFDADVGLPSIIEKIEFGEPDPRQICRVALNRLPESAALSVVRPDYDPASHLTSTLRSTEFQKGFVSLFSNAFPEKRRRIFVHVPKCAGTDLIAHLTRLYPSLGWALTEEQRTTKEALFARISALVRETLVSPDLFIYGHMGLLRVLNHELLRQGDEVFTVVRDPFEMVLSNVNYIITRLLSVAAKPNSAQHPDIIGWSKKLGIERLDPESSPSALLDLAKRILHEPSLIPDNRLCRSLGGVGGAKGQRVSAQSAHDNLVIANVEITDTQRYARWLRSKFSVVAKTGRNASRTVLSRETLAAADVEYVESITAEDRKVYDSIQAALARSDAPSMMADKLDSPTS